MTKDQGRALSYLPRWRINAFRQVWFISAETAGAALVVWRGAGIMTDGRWVKMRLAPDVQPDSIVRTR